MRHRNGSYVSFSINILVMKNDKAISKEAKESQNQGFYFGREDRKSTRLNSRHWKLYRMPSSA